MAHPGVSVHRAGFIVDHGLAFPLATEGRRVQRLAFLDTVKQRRFMLQSQRIGFASKKVSCMQDGQQQGKCNADQCATNMQVDMQWILEALQRHCNTGLY